MAKTSIRTDKMFITYNKGKSNEFKALQDVIGEHQDAVVAEEHLRRVAVPGTETAAGRLIERERQRKLELRARYPESLRTALRKGKKAFP